MQILKGYGYGTGSACGKLFYMKSPCMDIQNLSDRHMLLRTIQRGLETDLSTVREKGNEETAAILCHELSLLSSPNLRKRLFSLSRSIHQEKEKNAEWTDLCERLLCAASPLPDEPLMFDHATLCILPRLLPCHILRAYSMGALGLICTDPSPREQSISLALSLDLPLLVLPHSHALDAHTRFAILQADEGTLTLSPDLHCAKHFSRELSSSSPPLSAALFSQGGRRIRRYLMCSSDEVSEIPEIAEGFYLLTTACGDEDECLGGMESIAEQALSRPIVLRPPADATLLPFFLHALCRASVFGSFCCLWNANAFQNGMREAEAACEDLRRMGREVPKHLSHGLLLQTPREVLLSDRLLPYVRRLWLDTGALMRALENELDAMIRLIRPTVSLANRLHVPVGIMGEILTEQKVFNTLLDLGIDAVAFPP